MMETTETAIHPEEARMLQAQAEIRGVVLARRTAILRSVLTEYELTGALSAATCATVRAALGEVGR